METSGNMIRSLRQSKGLLLRELAGQLEIDSAILSKLERGERKATKEQIEQIASFFKLPDQRLKILWLSEIVLKDLQDYDVLASDVLKFCEERLSYNPKKEVSNASNRKTTLFLSKEAK